MGVAAKDSGGAFSCDFFASDQTFRMVPYMARYKCLGAAGVDAFTIEWKEGGFFNPPVYNIIEVVRYAKSQGAKGTLVTPTWEDLTFWVFLRGVKGL